MLASQYRPVDLLVQLHQVGAAIRVLEVGVSSLKGDPGRVRVILEGRHGLARRDRRERSDGRDGAGEEAHLPARLRAEGGKWEV